MDGKSPFFISEGVTVTEKHQMVLANKPINGELNAMLGFKVQPIRVQNSAGEIRPDVTRLQRASWAFTTRRVAHQSAVSIALPVGAPNAGDLILARVDVLGHHGGLQLANGRRKSLFVGDEIVVAFGNRYACNQFEALIPETLGPCHLVAGGGIASRALSWHDRIAKGPTHITPIGLLLDSDAKRVNLRDFAISPVVQISNPHPTMVAVIGTAMDSGKTQTAAYLVRGLIAAGKRVGYAKITGTGAGGDTWLLKDAGAFPVLDFTDAGMPTTYMASVEEVNAILVTLAEHIARAGVDAIVLEVADGVFQRETAALLRSEIFSELVGGVILAARDAMGASAGVNWLSGQRTPVLALSGLLSAAPLQAREAHSALGLPVYNRDALATPHTALELIGRAQQRMDLINASKNISRGNLHG